MAVTYLLVHGAWHGAWCWEKVMAVMRNLGKEVHALDLTGHGERAHLKWAASIETYTTDIVRYVEEHSLNEVVLVGHSMGGVPISKAAERIPERLSRLIYVTAFVLADGQCVMDNVPEDVAQTMKELAAQTPDRTIPVPVELFRTNFMNDIEPREQEEVLGRLTSQPIAPFTDRVDLKRFYELTVPKSYVHCILDISLPPGSWFPSMANRFREYTLAEIDSGHEVMFSQPDGLALALVDLAEKGGGQRVRAS